MIIGLAEEPCTMVVVSEDALLAVVDRIYDSIERPDLWPETICAVGELVGGRRDFWGVDPCTQGPNSYIFGTGCHPTFFLSRNDIKALDQYALEFGELIINFLKIVFLSTLWSHGDVSAREAVGLRMAQRYPQAFELWEGASVSSPSRPAWRRLITALWEDGRVFSRDNLRHMRLLAPHLDRASRLQMRLTAADLRLDMLSGALDCLTLGVVFVDSSGLPLWLNRRAQEIINGSNVLQLAASTELVGRSLPDTRSLRELVKKAVSGGTQGLLAISRGVDVRPLLLIALPLKPTGPLDPAIQSVCGVVFISDPDRIDNPTVDSLRRAFGLTYREAQLAIAIAHGNGLQVAADKMGVAATTARSQLQQVFAKTGTRQQAELAALMHRTLALVRHE
jgi:DNA-binding CsgD family transcriptional regulator/PAS domain-containing protein